MSADKRFVPNSFQTPNAIIDILMPLLTDSEFRVLMFMVRQILGWQASQVTKQARIAQSLIESGYTYTDSDGNEHEKAGCGVGREAIRNALKQLVKYRIVKKIGKASNDGQMWELSLLTDANPDLPGLKLRESNNSRKAKAQTEKARQMNPIFTEGGSSTSTPEGGSSTSTQGGSSTAPNETQETQERPDKGQPDQTLPDSLDADEFQKKITVVRDAGVLTPNDFDKFKVDADDYTLDQWQRGVARLIERRNTDGKYKGYGYLMTIMPDIEAEDKQAAASNSHSQTRKLVIQPVTEIHRPRVDDGMIQIDRKRRPIIEGDTA